MKYSIMKRLIILITLLILISGAWLPVLSQSVITLDAAIEFAGRNSPDIQRSLFNLMRARESLNAQRASLKSQFSLSVNPMEYSNRRTFDNRFSQWFTNENFTSSGTFRVDQPVLWTDGTLSLVNTLGWQYNKSDFTGSEEIIKTFSNDLYLSLTQPLFTYNRQKLELTEIELDYENANISYALQLLNLEKNVTQFFYNVHLAQMSLVIAQEELTNTQNSFDIIRNKVDAGLAAREELYQAELNLSTARSNLYNNSVALENAKDDFKFFLGMDLYENIIIIADISSDTVAVDLEKAVDYGLNSRMELRQREIDIETSQFQLIRTRSLNEFRGDLQISVGVFSENEQFRNIYDNPTQNPRVSLAFNVPLWDWGERKARIKAQEAVIKTQELNFDQQKLQIIIDIRKVYRNLENQLNQIDSARQNDKNAQLTYEINLERYENGDLTGMDLNLFQTQLSEKKMSLAQALINYKIELLNLKIQSLYDFEKNKPVIPSELFNDSEAILETLK